MPPYNGGLFDRERAPLLDRIRLGDRVMADVIDALSFERGEAGRRYINYRDLGVRQLGSIYERLLEHELVQDEDGVAVRPNIFARKGSGSYYTPEDLVGLIVEETVGPLLRARMGAFAAEAENLPAGEPEREKAITQLKKLDPAEALLAVKVCDPAMGSGHFLVSLVDYLADGVIAAMAEAEAEVEGYVSPLVGRIQAIRERILANSEERDWAIDRDRLDDRHIVRRMVLKRCVYGVDKNPMAVELAKVSLWLHTFTVGAPLSFLDHHLRCGDSLFGTWVRGGIDKAAVYGGPLLLHSSVRQAEMSALEMRTIEELTDAEIAEAHRSAETFCEVTEATAPLDAVLSLVHAIDWLEVKDGEGKTALQAFFGGLLGDPLEIALGRAETSTERPEGGRFAGLLQEARALIAEERFLNWQVAFPGVWTNWQSVNRAGGFDAVIGNPPWDRVRLEPVEWFATRRRHIALAQRAADRKSMVEALRRLGDPLVAEFDLAAERAESATRVARTCGNYPLLAFGEVNLYALFVERAMALVKPNGMVGLLTPSGIASDKTAARFFKGVATEGRLVAFYDFENRKGDGSLFFPDVHAQFKFCTLVASPSHQPNEACCAFFLRDTSELGEPERCFSLTSDDFERVNPNTGTAPIFRSRRDAELTTAIYGRFPVLVNRSSTEEVKSWPVKYARMFDMSNDSGSFRTREELKEQEGAYPIGGNRYRNETGEWVPLYEGKMIWHFDHRAASVAINVKNRHRPAYPEPTKLKQYRDASFVASPQYWVKASSEDRFDSYVLAFRDVTNPTDRRTFDACFIPHHYAGNTLPLLICDQLKSHHLACLCANLNALVFDYVSRQKVQKNHLSWYIVEQLPVVPPDRYEVVHFGGKTAGEIVREAVLELTYTAHDMAPFARDMGYIDDTGKVLPPFVWNPERRLQLRAKLDAVFFHLYGVTDRDDLRYVYSTFSIIERQETADYGTYRSRKICLAWMNALGAGDPDAEIVL